MAVLGWLVWDVVGVVLNVCALGQGVYISR